MHILAPYKSSGRYYRVHLFLNMPVRVLAQHGLHIGILVLVARFMLQHFMHNIVYKDG